MVKNYHVSGNRKTGYISKAEGAARSSFRGSKQKDVISQTRSIMEKQGGGELKIHSAKGPIRAANTIAPKKDNFPPRG